MARLRNIYALPCIDGCRQTKVTSAGIGRPRVIVAIAGQYYLFSSRLCCKVCRKQWHVDNPQWLEKLPKRFTNLLLAVLTYKKAICKSLLDELRHTGKSPTDMANQVMEMMHLKYERANLAYLLTCQSVQARKYGQKSITGFMRKETQPAPFGDYDDTDGWNGLCVSAHYLTDCLLHEYQCQKEAITKLLQGTFGQAFHSDHTRKVARKVTFTSATMSSYATMNEHWMVVSWVMVQSETEKSLEPMYQGLAHRYRMAGVEKAQYQWVDRDCCAAYRVPDPEKSEHLNWDSWKTVDTVTVEATSGVLQNTCASRSQFNIIRRTMQKLKNAYAFCGIQPANPTKQHIREHCRTKIPQPDGLLKRVEGVMKLFHLASDPNGVHLYKPSMLKTWRIQRVHILRGCISDPEVSGEILYRHDGGIIQLNHIQGEGAEVDVWIPIRGTSQQEGYHFHQAQWVTGTRMRRVDLKIQGVRLPGVFDPLLIGDLNTASARVLGTAKYPILQVCTKETGERLGLEYVEPGCRPVVLIKEARPLPSLQTILNLFPFPVRILHWIVPIWNYSQNQSSSHGAHAEPGSKPETTYTPPLPMLASPSGRVFVLDHKCWTNLNKHHGKKDMLKLVDQEYAAMVHSSCTDPNSMLHPNTRLHIAQYVKHLSKLLNTSTSLNTIPEKLQERQQLCHSLTEGSETTSVPVVTMHTAVIHPPAPAQTTPLTPESLEKIVEPIMEKQQQQQQKQQPEQRKQTCLAYGQPKSHYENDGSSVHFFFYQQGPDH
ncbi:uncharacterized protein LOC113642200 [Tachysurus ichikawai]